MSLSSVTADPARPSSPQPSSPIPAWSTASARSTTARPSPTTTKKKSRGSTRCRPALAYAEWNKQKINLIDAPGIGNFLSDARAALQRRRRRRSSSSTPSSGVDGQTEKVWASGRRAPACRGSSSSTGSIASAPASTRSLTSLREALQPHGHPIQLPIGEEKNFKGVVDLVSRRRPIIFQTDESGKFTEGAGAGRHGRLPSTAAREALIEMVAENDEKLMEKFFEAGTLTDDELRRRAARRDDRRRSCSRCVCTSATA